MLWVLVTLDHSIQEGRSDNQGRRRIVSRQFHFVEIDQTGQATAAGCAPYLDYRTPTGEEADLIGTQWQQGTLDWLNSDLEQQAINYGVSHLVTEHLREVRSRKDRQAEKTLCAVQERLTKEINYWDSRAILLRDKEEAGKSPGTMNSSQAQDRADELQTRLKRRLRFIDVKGRHHEATSVTVTAGEIRCALNSPEQSILAVVLVDPTGATETWYIRNAFENELDFNVNSVNCDLKKLMEKGVKTSEPPTLVGG